MSTLPQDFQFIVNTSLSLCFCTCSPSCKMVRNDVDNDLNNKMMDLLYSKTVLLPWLRLICGAVNTNINARPVIFTSQSFPLSPKSLQPSYVPFRAGRSGGEWPRQMSSGHHCPLPFFTILHRWLESVSSLGLPDTCLLRCFSFYVSNMSPAFYNASLPPLPLKDDFFPEEWLFHSLFLPCY